MAFPYPTVTTYTDKVNYASYISPEVSSLIKKTNVPKEKFFGSQEDDYIELSVFDSQNTLNKWSTIVQPKNYKTRNIQYKDSQNNTVTVSYDQFVSSFVLYENSKILLDPKTDLKGLGIANGSYKVVYNFQTNIIGSEDKQCLLIKQVSPSRKEIKVSLLLDKENFTDQDKVDLKSEFDCFTDNKIESRDVLSDFDYYLKQVYILNFVNVTPDSIKESFGKAYAVYGSDGLFKLMNEIYNGFQLIATSSNGIQTTESFIGISQYISLMLYENYNGCFSYDQYSKIFEKIVSDTINLRLKTIHDVQNHDTEICNTYLFQVFNGQIQSYLTAVYNDYLTKYVGPLKNSINFGNNQFYKIISQKKFSDGSLVIKLQNPLPINFGSNNTFWITNTSLAPIVQNVVLMSLPVYDDFGIKGPNFNLKINDKRTSNSITLYVSDIEKSNDVDLVLKQRFSSLNVDYSKFENFVVYSSAKTRIVIYKNKLSSINTKTNAISDILLSSYSDSYTVKKITDLQNEIDQIKLSFDGYEYYLYTNEYYNNLDTFPKDYLDSADEYDVNNRDSLINNLPEYLLLDDRNDDFIIFLSMIGHHFDNIYIYIDQFPTLTYNKDGSDNFIPNNFLNNMLESFGWKPQSLVNDVSLASNYETGTYVSSISSKANIINNRILNTLPAIIKAKGTIEGVKLLLACYGVPDDLLTVREFGSYADLSQSFYTFDKNDYLLHLTPQSYIDLPVGTEYQSIEFKFAFSNRYSKSYVNKTQIDLVKKYADSTSNVDYRIYAYKPTSGNNGQIVFEIGDRKIVSKSLPVFDGNVYSVLLRKNEVSDLYTSSNDPLLVPTSYDLIVEINDEGSIRLSSKETEVMTHDENILFTSGSNPVIRLGSSSFSGSIDKVNVWNISLSDSNFSEHCNNFESYYQDDYENIRDNLYFRLSYSYPRQLNTVHEVYTYSGSKTADLYNIPTVSVSADIITGDIQSNPSLYQDTIDRRKEYRGSYSTSSLYPYFNLCEGDVPSEFPYNFIEYTVAQSYRVSGYGPNLLWNNKISVKDNSDVTSITPFQKSTPYNDNIDSNLVGVFASPTSNKSSEILKFFGDKDIINELGDPHLEFSQSYDPLEKFRKAYYSAGSPAYSGRVLYQEFTSIYKLYFDSSIFESIKNITAARNKLLTGILVEPTILERIKFPTKPIKSEIVEDTVSFESSPQQSSENITVWSNDIIQHDTTSSFGRFESKQAIDALPFGDTVALNVNFDGNYIKDVSSLEELYVCSEYDGSKYITYLDVDVDKNNNYTYSVPYYSWWVSYSSSVESVDYDGVVHSYYRTLRRLVVTPKSTYDSYPYSVGDVTPACTMNNLKNRHRPLSSGIVIERSANNRFGIFKRSCQTAYYTVDQCGDPDKSLPIMSTIVTNTSISTNSSGVLTVN